MKTKIFISITRYKGHFIMVRHLIHKKSITNFKTYASNNSASGYRKQKLIQGPKVKWTNPQSYWKIVT